MVKIEPVTVHSWSQSPPSCEQLAAGTPSRSALEDMEILPTDNQP